LFTDRNNFLFWAHLFPFLGERKLDYVGFSLVFTLGTPTALSEGLGESFLLKTKALHRKQ